MTIYAVDNLPAPSDIELATLDQRINWPGLDVTPGTRCGYAFYCQYRNLNHSPYLWQWVEENCEPPPEGETRIYTVARWDSLVAMFEAQARRPEFDFAGPAYALDYHEPVEVLNTVWCIYTHRHVCRVRNLRGEERDIVASRLKKMDGSTPRRMPAND